MLDFSYRSSFLLFSQVNVCVTTCVTSPMSLVCTEACYSQYFSSHMWEATHNAIDKQSLTCLLP